jgi:hypothetical protein
VASSPEQTNPPFSSLPSKAIGKSAYSPFQSTAVQLSNPFYSAKNWSNLKAIAWSSSQIVPQPKP